MSKVLYKKGDITIKSEYGDIGLYTPYSCLFMDDTPENRKKICKIAEINMKDLMGGFSMESFDNLHAGDKIYNEIDGIMEVVFGDFYGDGKKIMCFADGKSVYPAFQFDPKDWELMK